MPIRTRQETVDALLETIEDLLATKDYNWARETLEGIASTVRVSQHVTVRQQEAVEHIIVGRLKHDRV
jgi:hypothetical protein